MAGLPTPGALTLRSGEPYVLHAALADAAGDPQLLSGRSFRLEISRTLANQVSLSVDATLSVDAFYMIVSLTGEQTAALYAEFAARAGSYAIREIVTGGEIWRGGDRIIVAPGTSDGSDVQPVTIDLPYADALISPAVVMIKETGARGLSAAEQFAIGGIDEGDPLTNAMFAALGDGIRAEVQDIADAAGQSETNAGEYRDQAQAARDIANEDAEATGADRAAVAGDKQTVLTAQEDVAGRQADIVERQDDVATRQQNVADRQADVMERQSDVSDRQADIIERQDDVTDRQAAVVTMQGDVALRQADVITRQSDVAGKQATVAADKGITQGYRDQAAGYASNAYDAYAAVLLSANRYPDYATGFAATTSGQYFLVIAPSTDVFATLYRNPSAAAIASFPNASALAVAVAALLTNATDAGSSHALTDKWGGVIAEFSGDGRDIILPAGVIRVDDGVISFISKDEAAPGVSTPQISKVGGVVRIGTSGTYISVDPVTGSISLGSLGVVSFDDGVAFLDGYGGVAHRLGWDGTAEIAGFSLNADSTITTPGGGTITASAGGNFSTDYIAAKNSLAEQRAAILRERTVSPAQVVGLSTKNTVFPVYGQSNSVGQMAHPAQWGWSVGLGDTFLGRTLGLRMMGNSLHGNSASGGPWVQMGSAAFNTMISTVRGTGDGTLLDASAQAALDPTASNLGQTIAETALATLSWLRLRRAGLASDTSRFIAYAAGMSGKSIAELSKGTSPDYYRRLGDGATIAKSIATGLGEAIREGGLIYLQGEQDGSLGTAPATWKTAFRQLRSDHHADTTLGVFGQTGEPQVPVYIQQICGAGIISPGGLDIANAQLDLALEDGGPILVSGYRGSSKGLHFDVNTTAWRGMQLGVRMFEHQVLGKVPFPFSPYSVETKGNQMLVTFLVPEPPIQFLDTYSGYTAAQPTNKGLFPWDATGDLTVTDVSIVASSTLLITCNRAFGASPALDYGRRTAPIIGAGNIYDSRKFGLLSHFYAALSGYDPQENTVSYAGTYFPGEEACCLFKRSATAL
ncbi:hypothetical protein SAMN05444678_102278 [Sphingomonas sp. YR710]|uniref:coiled-coil domain-containing protein n=1 Tax=Sphingomonas sp. YR710 TaxID=1882773 RepID=UPI00088D18E1|nr:hypothetical protein [Sphingomonas sp. YR710]SDC31428.1 hypothetical protein SAMN05444678_102278 [Sphingomonas sp. YR710]